MARLSLVVLLRVTARLAVLLFVGLPARGAERDIVRTFPAAANCGVVVDTYRGSIIVAEGDSTRIRVAVHLEIGADSEAEAEQLADSLHLEVTTEGSTIAIHARDPEQVRPRFVWNEKKQIEPTFRITVPASCNLDLSTRTGAITVGNVTGKLRASTDTGYVFFRRVGGRVEANTKTGDIVVSHCLGDLAASTGAGIIRVGTVTGRCTLDNGSGDIEVVAAKGDLHVYAEAGTASVGLPRDFKGRADISTSGGGIIASIDPAAECEIDAGASWLAHIENHLPLHIVSGHSGGRRLAGRLNHGGGRVSLRASGGNVTLLPGDSSLADAVPGG